MHAVIAAATVSGAAAAAVYAIVDTVGPNVGRIIAALFPVRS